MKTDLAHTLDLVDRIPPRTLLVSESGIKTNADLRRLHNGGAKAILVGESLMKSPDIGRAVDELLGR
jgi:indole-3-glycerol phosphate synthase